MRVRVLGSSAGGGLPQWNCGCENCSLARAGTGAVVPRTQDSVAISSDGERWLLFNASPDIHRQIQAFDGLHPRAGRATPIRGIVLTNGDLDHVLGLLSLRESTPLVIFATRAVRRGLVEGNTMLKTLERFEGQSTWVPLELDRTLDLDDGISLLPFALPGKVPKHLEGAAPPSDEDNIGVVAIERASGKRVVYAASMAGPSEGLARIEGADVAFFDGTFWTSDELIALGLGTARAEEMAHWPLGGKAGSLNHLASARVRRKIYTHVNNTNPILKKGSMEQALVRDAGFEIAFDGMDLEA